jgi:hypothetical protein
LSLTIFLGDFIIKLLLDLHENSLPLGLAMSGGLDHFLEAVLKLVTEADKVLGNLCFWVEDKITLILRVIVYHSVDESLSVAFVQERFDGSKSIIEGDDLHQLRKLHRFVETLALLKNSDGKSFSDESLVDLKRWELCAKGLKSNLTFFGDHEW